MKTKESYTPGRSETALSYVQGRHIARDAAFVLPHLKSG